MALVTAVSAGVIGSEVRDRAERRDAAETSPAALERHMARFEYRHVRADENDYVHLALSAVHFAYCPSPQECNTPGGNAKHPPVDVWGWSVIQISIWPPPSSVPGGRMADKRSGSCWFGWNNMVVVGVKDEQWPQVVAGLASRARVHRGYFTDSVLGSKCLMLPVPVQPVVPRRPAEPRR